MPDSIFLGHRYSRTAPPFQFLLPVAISRDTESYRQPAANEYPCEESGVTGLELAALMCNKEGGAAGRGRNDQT